MPKSTSVTHKSILKKKKSQKLTETPASPPKSKGKQNDTGNTVTFVSTESRTQKPSKAAGNTEARKLKADEKKRKSEEMGIEGQARKKSRRDLEEDDVAPSKQTKKHDTTSAKIVSKAAQKAKPSPSIKAQKSDAKQSNKNAKVSAKAPSSPSADSDAKEDEEPEEAEEGFFGFETDDDDDNSSDEDEEEDEPSTFDVSKLPTISRDDAVVKKKLEMAKRKPTEDRGVIYLGRIPHGFYEAQMKSYFEQFGNVTRLRLSRNKRTGRSKHYAFIEFDSSSVAQIVAETMDNYLLMGHILTCKLIPKDEVHSELWIGANRKWRKVPNDRVARLNHNKPRTEEEQSKAEARLLKRQEQKKRKLAEAGINYDFEAVAYKKKAKSAED